MKSKQKNASRSSSKQKMTSKSIKELKKEVTKKLTLADNLEKCQDLKLTLNNTDIQINQGKKICVLGKEESGFQDFILALSGEMDLIEG